MKLGTFVIIDQDGRDANDLSPLLTTWSSNQLRDVWLKFLAARLIGGRNTVVFAPPKEKFDTWFDAIMEIHDGKRQSASIVLEARLDNLVGGIAVTASLDYKGYTAYEISTHT